MVFYSEIENTVYEDSGGKSSIRKHRAQGVEADKGYCFWKDAHMLICKVEDSRWLLWESFPANIYSGFWLVKSVCVCENVRYNVKE